MPDALRCARQWLWLLAPVAIGGLFRFITLSHQSYWNDESATLAILHQPLHALFSAIRASESTPPLYYVLAWFWAHVFGYGEAGVRSLSALFGTATIAVVGVVAHRLGGVRAGRLAAWFAATSPLLFWYSQEARAYSLFVFLSAVSLGCTLALRERPSAARAVAFTAVGIAAGATHYFAGFLIGAELCVLAIWPGERLRRELLIGPSVALVAAAVPLAMLAHAQYANSNFVRSQGLPKAVGESAGQLLVGYGVDAVMITCGVLAGLGLLVCAWLALRRRRELSRGFWPLAAVLVLAAIVPLVVALAGAQLIDTRNLLFVLPLLAVLAAVASAGRERRLAAAIVVTMLAGLAVIVHIYFDPTLQRTNYRGAAVAIGTASAPRVVLVEMSGQTDLQQYMPGLSALAPAGARVSEIVLVGMTTSGGLNRDVATLPALRFQPPAGFRQVQTESSDTFTLRRFRAARPMLLTPAELERQSAGSVQVLVKPGGR